MVRLLFVVAACLAMLVGTSCSEDYLPTAPPAPRTPTAPPPARTSGEFIGNVMDADTHRMCIDNARAEIISGPLSGTVFTQNLSYCEESSSGFVIRDLPFGSVLKLRASAPGFTSRELEFVIEQSGGGSVDINLKRAG